ncbi:MAG: HEAT repeat domain-containing protein [Candidatus Heimdallarchaeaceae archaeon]
MEEKFLKRMENFKNTPDRLKFELLKELSELPEEKRITNFLLSVVENEKYERIRINAIINLKKYESDLIVEKLKTIFSFERDKSVRLVIVETLGERDSDEIDNFFQQTAIKDLNDIVRATTIRKLHERENMDQTIMHDLLIDIIQNDSSVFPKQIALSALPCYATSSTYDKLRNVFFREQMHQMKKFLYRTLEEISTKMELDLDVKEPEDPIFEDTKKARKQRRKERKKKKLEKDDFLYF